MKTSFLIQSKNGARQDILQAAVTACIGHGQLDCARVAVAYATVSGARALQAAFDNHGLQESRWLLGLDDALTQPGAIALLRSLPHSTVHIASFEKSRRRFHPKFYAFARAGSHIQRVLVVLRYLLTVVRAHRPIGPAAGLRTRGA